MLDFKSMGLDELEGCLHVLKEARESPGWEVLCSLAADELQSLGDQLRGEAATGNPAARHTAGAMEGIEWLIFSSIEDLSGHIAAKTPPKAENAEEGSGGFTREESRGDD